jgi:hypothetical protein
MGTVFIIFLISTSAAHVSDDDHAITRPRRAHDVLVIMRPYMRPCANTPICAPAHSCDHAIMRCARAPMRDEQGVLCARARSCSPMCSCAHALMRLCANTLMRSRNAPTRLRAHALTCSRDHAMRSRAHDRMLSYTIMRPCAHAPTHTCVHEPM